MPNQRIMLSLISPFVKPRRKALTGISSDSAFSSAKRISTLVKAIPFGKTVTYGEIAARLAAERGFAKTSARAVGGAVGHNPISLIIPCHRVVGANGSLTGYAGGIDKKRFLLSLEGVRL